MLLYYFQLFWYVISNYFYGIVEITSAARAIHFHRRGDCTPDYINKHQPAAAVGPQGVEILDSAQPRWPLSTSLFLTIPRNIPLPAYTRVEPRCTTNTVLL